jgi:hypothetical protein
MAATPRATIRIRLTTHITTVVRPATMTSAPDLDADDGDVVAVEAQGQDQRRLRAKSDKRFYRRQVKPARKARYGAIVTNGAVAGADRPTSMVAFSRLTASKCQVTEWMWPATRRSS